MSTKICPGCGSRRPSTEVFCQGTVGAFACAWDLTGVPLDIPGTTAPAAEPSQLAGLRCRNGHTLRAGDLFCPVCGEEVEEVAQPAPASQAKGQLREGEGRHNSPDGFGGEHQTGYDVGGPAPDGSLRPTPDALPTIGVWSLVRRIGRQGCGTETWAVRRTEGSDEPDAILVLHPASHRADAAAATALATLASRFATAIDRGQHEQRPFEVYAADSLHPLSGLIPASLAPDRIRKLIAGMAGILTDLGRLGVRHRDICPDAILVDGQDFERVVLSRSGAARHSPNELDTAPPPELTRYAAPELLAGAVTAASDWWSLGIVVLEAATRGACFEGIEDQAFLMHVIAGGLEIPDTVDPGIKTVLQGLLAKDRAERWQGEQVQAWLNGTPVALPSAPRVPGSSEADETTALYLSGRSYRRVTAYALAAARKENWEEARDQLVHGRLSAWLEGFASSERMRAAIRNVVRREDLDDDAKLSVALKHLNADMPLVRAGEIITPAWLLQHSEAGHDFIAGPMPDLLPQGGAESWLRNLKQRASEVRRRLKSLEIEVDEPSLRLHLLSTSRKQFLELWDERRRMLPDSEHRGIAALLERGSLRDEDLIILLSAATSQFVPLAEAVAAASQLARREGISSFSEVRAEQLLLEPRHQIMNQLDARIEGFARSRNERIDAWVDQYRLEKRISLPRILVALSLPIEAWRKPPRQDYVAQLLGHFEKRIGTSVSRGALARMTIGKSSPRIDLTEIGTRRMGAGALLDHLLERGESAIDVDPAAFDNENQIEHRLRRLVRNADLQRRETGINGLYLGFPFVLMRPRGDTAKPRIAPVLLWPIAIHAEVGQRARFRLAFDRDREEVRVNPALQGMLAPDALAKWEAAGETALSGVGNATAVMDELGVLADKVRERVLAKLPGPDTRVAAEKIELSCSAVLFHVTFVGQAIVNDIHQLQSIPPAGTGLETLLRSGEEGTNDDSAASAAHEIDRFITADTDPAQDRAVARARGGAGLVIEGPPGTGKSQTIVNLVADAIGRKNSLLLVCQKQAALDVVHKRLEREGLGGRIIMVKDPTKDRRAILEQIRSQIDHLRANGSSNSHWRRQRAEAVGRITRLEAQINERHIALRARDETSGRSYRETIGDLIEIEAVGAVPDVSTLRPLLALADAETADAVAEQCGALAPLWLPARYEGSALHAMKQFASDAAAKSQCLQAIETFAQSERRRRDAVDPRCMKIDANDAAALGAWATLNATQLLRLDAAACAELGRLVGSFEAILGTSPGREAIAEVARLRDDISTVPDHRTDAQLGRVIGGIGDLELAGWLAVAADALKPRGWLARMLGGGKAARRKLEQLLAPVSPVVGEPVMRAFQASASHELQLRELKSRLDKSCRSVGADAVATSVAALSKSQLLTAIGDLASSLGRVQAIHNVLSHSPIRKDAITAALQGTPTAFATLFDAITRALTLASARRASITALEPLTQWLTDDWIGRARSTIEADASNAEMLARLVDALPSLDAFQRFRLRAAQLSPLGLEVYAALRPKVDKLGGEAAKDSSGNLVERIIKREARLSWKLRLEAAAPMLAAEEAEIAALVRSLATAEEQLKLINRESLAANIETGRVGDRASWDDITRYTGPRSRRLREFLELGSEIGLMELRPVWLMSPDVASRLLPLVNGLFDRVVYDEASQMPVEYALPTLYRGRKVVVSGDEKQLPPTSFFAARSTRDQEGADLDGTPEDIDEEERDAAIEAWNRREIQDCPNLLELSKSVLPTEQLEVHYRSQFRELITFSNAAFYAGTLNVPVRHPEAEVDRFRPLELIHVNGLYENRTNVAEADRVVAMLEKLWLDGGGKCPTTGVVTFNRDQADLIEERLEDRAEESEEFRSAYVREVERFENGEDMGFFVKNVENVQGDERDHILFSTTFGRNAQGAFRRNFGVLGQAGGERRLNVAITRARQRVTIFTSMPIGEIADVLGSGAQPAEPRDYLQLYLAYADAVSRHDHEGARRLLGQLGSVRARRSRATTKDGDAFVRSVATTIEAMGFTLVQAGDGSAFGIDLAIPHPRKGGFGIGIECDAADHPLLTRPHAREVWRPAVMRRSLPAIHRISCRGWYHDREQEVGRLRAAVEAALK